MIFLETTPKAEVINQCCLIFCAIIGTNICLFYWLYFVMDIFVFICRAKKEIQGGISNAGPTLSVINPKEITTNLEAYK